MSDRPPKGLQIDVITPFAPQIQESFDLKRLDIFVTSLGVDLMHYRAMPSPLGKNDRGDLRRNDGVDQITSNGMIYRLGGVFTATMTDNSREQKRSQSGVVDPSESKLVMPRFYNKKDVSDGDRIYLMPGDRLYFSDPNADVLVANSQEMNYQENIDNEPMFPIISLQDRILDSRNIEYIQGVDFTITTIGNIRWTPGANNPGIDPNTGKGRLYSIRYLYKAFYYVVALPKEVRVTNVTTGGVRSPQRMPMHAIIVREYIFHQRNQGDVTNQLKPKDSMRTIETPQQSIDPNKTSISVDMTNIVDDDEQS